jgi:hypothetical protein
LVSHDSLLIADSEHIVEVALRPSHAQLPKPAMEIPTLSARHQNSLASMAFRA